MSRLCARLYIRVSRPDIEYFSILRPFSELDIVRRFSTLTRFTSVYSSCNRNFHQLDAPIAGRWCGDCPKCRFAALSLAVFLDPARSSRHTGQWICWMILRRWMASARLCALGRDKPFECVGEAGESRAALADTGKTGAMAGSPGGPRLAAGNCEAVDVPALTTDASHPPGTISRLHHRGVTRCVYLRLWLMQSGGTRR